MLSISLGAEQDPNKWELYYHIADVFMTINISVILPKSLNFTELHLLIHTARKIHPASFPLWGYRDDC